MALTDDLEAAQHAVTTAPLEPPKTHTADRAKSESVLVKTLKAMEDFTFRKRLPQRQSLRTGNENGESSTSSGIELTPTSSEDSEKAQGVLR